MDPISIAMGLAQFALRLTKLLRTQLGYFILVVLEDSRNVADTLKAWMEPLAKVAEVTKAIAHMRPVDPSGVERLSSLATEEQVE